MAARSDRAAEFETEALVILHGIMERARKTPRAPVESVRDVEKPPQRRGGAIEVLAPDEVRELVRAAASEQDAALYLTAAFTGLASGTAQ